MSCCIGSNTAKSIRCLRYKLIVAALLGLTTVTSPAYATSVEFIGSSGNLSASAEFSILAGGSELQVVLTNTSKDDVLVPTQVLTAVFFDMKGTLTPISALLDGSSVFFASPGGNVGGEWGYKGGLSGAPGGATKGISSSGLGLFGKGNFNGSELQGPKNGALDGLQYGITSAGDNPNTGNKPVTGKNALIENAVTFLLSCSPSPCDLNDIKNVSFQYGTALTDPNTPGVQSNVPIDPVPLPPALLLFGPALMGLTMLGRRRRNA